MADFQQAVELLLLNEGGYVNDPTDSGGETKWGISARSYPNLQIYSLSLEQAKEIYRQDYWLFDDVSSQAVANKLLDMAVNMGLVPAVRLLQGILGVSIDGRFGPNTLTTANAVDPASLVQALRVESAVYYAKVVAHDTSKLRFIRGWMRRAIQ